MKSKKNWRNDFGELPRHRTAGQAHALAAAQAAVKLQVLRYVGPLRRQVPRGRSYLALNSRESRLNYRGPGKCLGGGPKKR